MPSLQKESPEEKEKKCSWCSECHEFGCPIEASLKFIGKKFSILIMREFFKENTPVRFNEFLKAIKKITPKTLSTRLKELEKNGLIQKKIFNETPQRVEYSLTKKGSDLKPIMEALAEWGKKQHE
ncbi:MAG: helix-turn-helix domain-containing protein [Candidatus ainarchaeum sp.]|nr:helix-turn-helix domain-containing protein [Candidatus ainarchaeum sp.]